MEKEMKGLVCNNCNKVFERFMFEDFNLGLCKKCLESFEESGKIDRVESIDVVTHVVTCPLCKKKYGMGIVDEHCETKDCPVRFFWDSLDCVIFARWIK